MHMRVHSVQCNVNHMRVHSVQCNVNLAATCEGLQLTLVSACKYEYSCVYFELVAVRYCNLRVGSAIKGRAFKIKTSAHNKGVRGQLILSILHVYL